MKIYLVRHGQSEWQLQRSNNWDTSLTSLGRTQAKAMACWLASHENLHQGFRLEFGSLFSSDMRRAMETAQYVSDALALPVLVDPDLREATFHVASQLPSRAGPFEEWSPHIQPVKYGDFKDQVDRAFRRLVEACEMTDAPVLAITHGGFVKTLVRILAGSDFLCLRLYNCALSSLEWRRGRWHLVHLNLWDHLPVAARTE